MMRENWKRCLSLILAMVLTFSLLPVSALASEGEEHSETIAMETTSPLEVAEAPLEIPEETTIPVTEETVPVTTVPVTEETVPETTAAPVMVVEETAPVIAASSNKNAVQAAMDAIVGKYLDLTKVLTAEDVAEAVAEMDEDTWFEALIEVEDLEYSDAVHALSEEELLELTEKNPLFCAFIDAVYERAAMPGDASLYTDVDVLTGQVRISDTANKGSGNASKYTATAKGGLLSKATSNITITNISSSTAQISFDWSVASSSAFTDPYGKNATSGSYSGVIEPNGTVTMSMTSKNGFSGTTVTLTLTNITYTVAADSSKVTIEFDSTLGSVTADGSEITSGTTQDVSLADGVALVATPKSGAKFLGWLDPEKKYIDTNASYTLKVASDTTVKAIFASATSKAWFIVDNTYVTNDLADAVSLGTTIVLAHDGTLPARLSEDGKVIPYEIPKGDTLLIPYNTAHTVQRATPSETDATFVAPTAFRTLTMAKNAAITVNGEMSVSGIHSAKMGTNGCPHGPQGFVVMNEGSSISVNGTLYAWGYIVSEKRTNNTTLPKTGSITINASGQVYECFQAMDYRGGDATSGMTSGDNTSTYKVFPMSQYYVQNVQVPMTLMAGATETGYMSVTVTGLGIKNSAVPFVGSNAMFRISSGYIVKDYDEVTDRTIIDIHGELAMSSMSMTIQTGILPVTIKSADYVLPISSHLTINLKDTSKLNISQDFAIFPGAQINISDEAELSLGTGVNLYLYDASEWGGYVGTAEKKLIASKYAYNRVAARGESTLVDAAIKVNGLLDASLGYIYTTTSGANIYSDNEGQVKTKVGSNTATYQVENQEKVGSSQELTYKSIPVTPAKLKNADGTDVETSTQVKTPDVYTYVDGKWHKNCDGKETTTTEPATCTEDGYTKTACACGIISEITPIPSRGYHTEGEGVVTEKPTTTKEGKMTYYCTVCEEVTKTESIPKLTAGVIYATNIRIGDTLDLFFYIKKSTLSAEKSYVAVVAREENGETTTELVTQDSEDWQDYNSSYYRIRYDGIAAKEMTDTVSVTIHEANSDGTAGNQFSETATDSIRGYAIRSLKTTKDAELITAIIDMLNYGASAQQQFNYETGDLANSGDAVIVDNLDKETASVSYELDSREGNSENFYGLNITLENNLYLNFYFMNVPENTTATSSYTKHNNDAMTADVPYSEFTSKKGMFNGTEVELKGVQVKGLGIADGRQDITCTLSNGDVAVASIEGFVAATIANENAKEQPSQTLIQVCENLMKFVDSAYAYFH